MPAIKREDHPVSPDLSRVPEIPRGTPLEAQDVGCPHNVQLPPVISSSVRPYVVANQAHLAHGLYFGSSPRKYRLSAFGQRHDRAGLLTPQLSRFPSRLASAMATATDHATTPTTTITVTNGRATIPQILNNINTDGQNFQQNQSIAPAKLGRMDEHLAGADPGMDNVESGGLPPMNIREQDDDTCVFVSRSQLEELRYGVQLLHNQHAASEVKVQNQSALIAELITFGQTMHNMIEHLNERVRVVESVNAANMNRNRSFATPAPAVQPVFRSRGDDDSGRSRSPSSEREEYRDRGKKGLKKKGRRDLSIAIPGKLYAPPPAAGTLPTPLSQPSSSSTQLPKTPITPGRTGPPLSAKKISTCVNKRNIHNLDQMVPPAYAHIPLLPLTDTEIIVYLFNSLCRPIVSLRLYARGWGPAAISDVVNTHRIVQPAYLRNTCSVKCTTAIKKGIELYGEQWSATNREIFQDDATLDDKATDMIRLSPDEMLVAVDYEIRALCNGLKKHPEDGEGSIFTRCVKYCEETNATYTLSDVFELASDLEAGRPPRRGQDPAQECKTEDSPSSTRSD